MIEEIITRRRNGSSFRQIAKELNTTAGKVHYRWHKWLGSQEQEPADYALLMNSKAINKAELFMESISDRKVSLQWQANDLPKKAVNHFFQCDFDELVQVVRLYDVTKIIFNGSNSHHYYEITVSYSQEFWLVKGLPANRDYIAELGVKITENDFFPILRSNVIRLGQDNEHIDEKTFDFMDNGSPAWREHVSTYTFYQETQPMEIKNEKE